MGIGFGLLYNVGHLSQGAVPFPAIEVSPRKQSIFTSCDDDVSIEKDWLEGLVSDINYISFMHKGRCVDVNIEVEYTCDGEGVCIIPKGDIMRDYEDAVEYATTDKYRIKWDYVHYEGLEYDLAMAFEKALLTELNKHHDYLYARHRIAGYCSTSFVGLTELIASYN